MRPQPPLIKNLVDHALFFDIDGTLAEVAPSPDQALIDPGTLSSILVLRERSGGAVALISGRQIADIDRMTGVPDLILAGIHGAQMRDASGRVTSNGTSRAIFADISEAAVSRYARTGGVLIEVKPLSVALHFRAEPSLAGDVAEFVIDVVSRRPELKRLSGKMIEEIVPRSADKGGALLAFLSQPPFKGRTPVFFGDDTTDEDGFAAVNSQNGISVKIGGGPSAARFGFPDSKAFRDWLADLASPDAVPRTEDA